jgi:hypothetical protein
MAFVSTEYLANMSRTCIWHTSAYKIYVYKIKRNFIKKIIGSPMSGGPVGGGKYHCPPCCKEISNRKPFCSSGSFNLDGKRNSTKLLSLSRDFSKAFS